MNALCRSILVVEPDEHGSQPGTIAWAEEARHLMPMLRAFDGFVRLQPTCPRPLASST